MGKIDSYDRAIELLEKYKQKSDIQSDKNTISAYLLIKILESKYANYYKAFYGPDFKNILFARWEESGKEDNENLKETYDRKFTSLWLEPHKANSFSIMFDSNSYYIKFYYDAKTDAFYYEPEKYFDNRHEPKNAFKEYDKRRNRRFIKSIDKEVLDLFHVLQEYKDYTSYLISYSSPYVEVKDDFFKGEIKYFPQKIFYSLEFQDIASEVLNGVWNDERPSIKDLFEAQKMDIFKKIPVGYMPTAFEKPYKEYLDGKIEIKEKVKENDRAKVYIK